MQKAFQNPVVATICAVQFDLNFLVVSDFLSVFGEAGHVFIIFIIIISSKSEKTTLTNVIYYLVPILL